MFFSLPSELAELPSELQKLLDQHNPYPEDQIARLCQLAASTADTKVGSDFRRATLDVDTLLTDLRWHVGQAILILRGFPALEAAENESVAMFDKVGMPTRAWALLRPFVVGNHQIYHSDMMARGPTGGRVAGWMLHMLVDSAVFRSVAVLDRLAHLIILAAEVPAPRGRMYFRSGKFSEIRKSGVFVSEEIIELATSQQFDFLLDYRDGFAHTVRPITKAMGTPPADSYTNHLGEEVRQAPSSWTSEDLVGIGLLAFDLCIRALDPTADVCRRYILSGEI